MQRYVYSYYVHPCEKRPTKTLGHREQRRQITFRRPLQPQPASSTPGHHRGLRIRCLLRRPPSPPVCHGMGLLLRAGLKKTCRPWELDKAKQRNMGGEQRAGEGEGNHDKSANQREEGEGEGEGDPEGHQREGPACLRPGALLSAPLIPNGMRERTAETQGRWQS
jgi:hypothetical protein